MSPEQRARCNARWRELARDGRRVDLGESQAALVDQHWTWRRVEEPLDLPQGTVAPPGFELVGRRHLRTVLGWSAEEGFVAVQHVERVYEIRPGGPLRDPRAIRRPGR